MRKTTTLIIAIISVFLIGAVSAALTQKPVRAEEKLVQASSAAGSNFDSSCFNPAWEMSDPWLDSSFSLIDTPGHLRINVPYGGNDLHPSTNYAAPRLLLSRSGDFTATTKVTSMPYADYQGAGILVWQDIDNFVRLEYGFGGTGGGHFRGIRLDKEEGGAYSVVSPNTNTPLPNSPVFLRLQRTGTQFSTAYSLDGNTWTNIVQATINLQDSIKVGLGAINQSGARFEAAYDFVKIDGENGASFFDDFDSNCLGPEWSISDPNFDSSLSLAENPGHLRITVPFGGNDLYAPANNDAPRLLRQWTGDFTAVTKVTAAPTYNYQGAGILVWQDHDNFARLELGHVGGGVLGGIHYSKEEQGIYSTISHQTNHPVQSTPVFLRLTRVGNQFSAAYSQDMSAWNDIVQTTINLSQTVQIGLLAVNEWQNHLFTADFDFFHVSDVGPYAISGKVTDENLNALGGVPIYADSYMQAATDASGVYTVTGLATGTYALAPAKKGYSFTPASRPVNLPPDALNQDFAGTKLPISETLRLDMFDPTNDMVIGPASTSVALDSGKLYFASISGTFSEWWPESWRSVCKGVVEDLPQTLSLDTNNGKVGFDVEYLFASPAGYPPCNDPTVPAPWTNNHIEISLDNGVTWFDPTPIDPAYNTAHTYTYLLTGQGFPALVRYVYGVSCCTNDNYGMLTVQVREYADQIPTLTVGSMESVTVSPLEYHYYEIDVQAGQNLLISLDKGAGLHAAVSYGQLPTAYDYDFIAKSSSSDSSLEIPIAPTIAGKYYLLVYAPYLSSGSIDVDIRADYVDLHLSSISPNQAGNAGNFTAEIKGTGLAQDTEVTLISPSGHRITGQGQILALDTTLFSTFVLTGAETGAYDLEIKRPSDGATGSIQDAVQINPGTGGRLKVWLEGPDVVRPGRTYQYHLVYENVGDADILAPFLTVSASDPDTVLYADNYNTNNTITWLASGDDGLSGYVLSPGHGGKIPFMVSTDNRVELKASLLKEDDTPFDWSEIERGLRPADIADAEWNTFWNKTKQEIGSTNSEVLNTLRAVNVYHGSSSKYGDLLQYAIFLVHYDPIVSNAEELISALYAPENDVKLFFEGGFNKDHGTIVVTHGWNGQENEPRFVHLAETLKSQYPLSNVVRVTWQQGATSPAGCDQVEVPGGIIYRSPLIGRANCASLVAKNIEPAAYEAVEQFNALGYSRWEDTIYIGESFGNGINAHMSDAAESKGYSTKTGKALVLNSASPIGYIRVKTPNFKGWFSESTAIQTTDVADDHNTSLAQYTIKYVDPDCGGKRCNPFGKSHTSAIRLIDCLLGGRTHPTPGCGNIGENPDLAKMLIENRIDERGLTAYQNYFDGQIHSDGSFDILKNVIYVPGHEIEEIPLYEQVINPVRPIDPNDKVGPAGLGALQVVSSDSTLDYTINFENLSSATAPVQELVVIDDLDSHLDWSTFQFSAISYGSRVIPVSTGEGVLEFQMQDLPPSDVVVGTAQGDLAIDITMKLNIQTGRIEWRLKVIDTATGDFPADPLAGFLPPEDGTGRGQGYVSFSIKPKADIAEGTQITNEASITFDTNAPIQTNQVRNTVGTAADLVLLLDQTPEPFVVAQPLTYTFIVINDGPDPATNVLLTDTLPGTVTLASAYAGQGTCSQASPVVCNLGTMAKDGRTTVTIVVTPTMNGTLHNTATVTSTIIELNDLDNSAAATIAGMPDTGVYLPLIVRE